MIEHDAADALMLATGQRRIADLSNWLGSEQATTLLSKIVLAGTAGVILYYLCIHMQLADAYFGESARLLVLLVRHPGWFPGDFPGGTEELLKSPIMWVYPAADYLGFNIYAFSYVMLGLEISTLAASGVIATRILKPEARPEIGYLVALFFVAGRLFNSDLAMFGHPVYGWGL